MDDHDNNSVAVPIDINDGLDTAIAPADIPVDPLNENDSITVSANRLDDNTNHTTETLSSRPHSGKISFTGTNPDETPTCSKCKAPFLGEIMVSKINFYVEHIGGCCCCGGTDIHILHDVYVSIPSGKLTALMGASGAGKSTLLNQIAGRAKMGGRTTGRILFDAHDKPGKTRRFLGFVEQFDVLPGTFTVRQALFFTADLKLPQSMDKEAKQKRVDQVIKMLSLEKIADKKIGPDDAREISGGQAKRVSIAIEIISDPPILLLDEPTSGQDTRTALSIVSGMKRVAHDGGQTVIATIHQPSRTAFQYFNHLILMLNGRVIYCGPTSEFRSYLHKMIGFTFPDNLDVCDPDYFLEKLESGQLRSKDSLVTQVKVDHEDQAPVIAEGGTKPDEEVAIKWADMWMSTDEAKRIQQRADEQVSDADGCGLRYAASEPQYVTSSFKQWRVLSKRAFIGELSSAAFIVYRLVLVILINPAGIATMWWSLLRDDKEHFVANVASTSFVLAVAAGMALMGRVTDFMKTRALVHRERSSGTYRSLPHFMSTMTLEAPFNFLTSAVYAIILYWACGLRSDARAFFFFFLIAYLINNCCVTIGQLVSIIAPDMNFATAFAPVIYLTFAVQGGYLLPKEYIPWYWRALVYYANPLGWGFSGILINEYEPIYNTIPVQETLDRFGFLNQDKWLSVWILISIWGGATILAYIAQRFIKYTH